MKHTPVTRMSAIALLSPMIATAQQESVEILLDDTTLGGSVTAGETVTEGGVTMTVTEVAATDGGNSAAVDDFGILFGTETVSNDTASIGVSFNVDVGITAYMIGSREDVPPGMHFTVTGGEGASGQNSVPSHPGFTEQEITLEYVPGDLTVLKAGQTYTISHNLLDAADSDPLFNLESLFVTPLDLSIEFLPNLIQIEYVGTLQQWSPENGWQDMDPQPPNSWQITPDAASKLFRARTEAE